MKILDSCLFDSEICHTNGNNSYILKFIGGTIYMYNIYNNIYTYITYIMQIIRSVSVSDNKIAIEEIFNYDSKVYRT